MKGIKTRQIIVPIVVPVALGVLANRIDAVIGSGALFRAIIPFIQKPITLTLQMWVFLLLGLLMVVIIYKTTIAPLLYTNKANIISEKLLKLDGKLLDLCLSFSETNETQSQPSIDKALAFEFFVSDVCKLFENPCDLIVYKSKVTAESSKACLYPCSKINVQLKLNKNYCLYYDNAVDDDKTSIWHAFSSQEIVVRHRERVDLPRHENLENDHQKELDIFYLRGSRENPYESMIAIPIKNSLGQSLAVACLFSTNAYTFGFEGVKVIATRIAVQIQILITLLKLENDEYW